VVDLRVTPEKCMAVVQKLKTAQRHLWPRFLGRSLGHAEAKAPTKISGEQRP